MAKHLITPYLKPLRPKPTGVKPRGRLQHPIRCLLCDIYGTLLISASGDIGSAQQPCEGETSLRRLLAKYKLPYPPNRIDEKLKDAISLRHRLAKAAGTAFPEVEIDEVWQSVLGWSDLNKIREFAVEYEMIINPVWPMPGLHRLLTHCVRHGIRLGIISNAQFYTPLLMEMLLEADLSSLGFNSQLTIFSYQMGLAKPSSELFQLAVDRLVAMGIEAKHAAYLGNDMRNDVSASQQAGFQTILYAGDRRSLRWRQDDPLCIGIVPDLVIDDLVCLLQHL